MTYAADLHLHSPYAYACSKQLTLENLSIWAKLKGIDLLASADFTHPAWRSELRRKLVPAGPGLFRFNGVHFVLGTEVNCVFEQDGRHRRVHLLLLVPDFHTVDRLVLALALKSNSLESDGRPTLRMSARDFTATVLDINPACVVIPAHVWTPWYGAFGSKSGFDQLEECFQDMVDAIPAVETGLSSDPAMNWSIVESSGKSIVSFSDAHSLPKLGRELTVFPGEPSYVGLTDALAQRRVAYTIEFYPQEGKYHHSGHRKCGVRQSPEDTDEQGDRCPVCGRALTLGVLHRVRELSGEMEEAVAGPDGFVREDQRTPFIRLVPLVEIIGQTFGQGSSTKKVEREYLRVIQEVGSEIGVLLNASSEELGKVAGERLAEAVLKARMGDVRIEPGYDGAYGKIHLWPTS